MHVRPMTWKRGSIGRQKSLNFLCFIRRSYHAGVWHWHTRWLMQVTVDKMDHFYRQFTINFNLFCSSWVIQQVWATIQPVTAMIMHNLWLRHSMIVVFCRKSDARNRTITSVVGNLCDCTLRRWRSCCLCWTNRTEVSNRATSFSVIIMLEKDWRSVVRSIFSILFR